MMDPYDDHLRAARYRAERDQAREELARAEGGARAPRRTYDALSDEDRRNLWWVHARGGLRDVKRQRKKSVPREVYERKRAAWRCHIRECEEALRKRNRRIKELESAALERRTVRAEDREAAEWVRGHGGLDAVEKQWGLREDVAGTVGEALWGTPDRVPDDLDEDELRVELFSRLMPAGYAWDDRFSGAVDFYESMHDLLYTVDCDEDHDGPEMVREVMRRLMPRGYEWPRYEDGEPVILSNYDQRPETISCVAFEYHSAVAGYTQPFVQLNSMTVPGSGTVMLNIGERVRRPAPKVLDADGVPHCKGDEVWNLDGTRHGIVSMVSGWDESPIHRLIKLEGDPCWHQADRFTHKHPVLAADERPVGPGMDVWRVCEGDDRGAHAERLRVGRAYDDGTLDLEPYGPGTSLQLESSEVYVEKPVLAADGKPVVLGERSYLLDTGSEVVIGEMCGEDTFKAFSAESGAYIRAAHASEITHERPDSWERLEEDARGVARDIAWNLGNWSPSDFESVGEDVQARVVDFVRRAKALAERDGS